MRSGWLVFVLACGAQPPVPVSVDAGVGRDATTEDGFSFDDATPSIDAGPPWPPCTATAQAPLLATCQITPAAIAVDDVNVYWTNLGHYILTGGKVAIDDPIGDGALMKCAKTGCGGTPTALVANILPGEIDTNGGSISALTVTGGSAYVETISDSAYWIDSCAAVGCGGSANPAFGTETLLFGLISDETNLYWVEESSSYTTYTCVAASCDAAMAIWTTPPHLQVADVAVDAENVYWTVLDYYTTDAGFRGLVMTCPKVGCSTPTIIAVTGATTLDTLAVDDVNVYFGASWGIASCPKTGCTTPTTMAGNSVSQIASDGTTVYWVSTNGSTTSIESCATAGCTGSPTVVTTQGGPFAIDATTIYWLSDLGEDNPPCGSVHSQAR